MKINPNVSIFIQLADHIRFEIFSKIREPGSKIESIREMAIRLEVNPNTIKHVYEVLEEEGLIYTKGTLGFFIIEDENVINTKRDLFINDKFKEFIEILKKCNVEEKDILKYIRKDEK